MTHYKVTHLTEYEADTPVSVCHNQAWLKPRETRSQRVVSHRLDITPEPSTQVSRIDTFGNHVTHLSFNEGYERLVVLSESEIEITPADWCTIPTTTWEAARDTVAQNPTQYAAESEFRFQSRLVRMWPELIDYAAQDFQPGRSVIEAVTDLTRRIHEEFEYDPRATTISTPVEHVFEQKRGVCQDFAHVQIAMLRAIGLPARYVSGYVRTDNVPERPDMIGADASHAWVGVFCPVAGWVDADPTNNCLTSEDHVTIAWGRDYSDIPPLRGVYIGGGKHRMKVEVSVR